MTDKQTPKLKPCPTCGNPSVLVTAAMGEYWVHCQMCKSSAGMCGNWDSAVELWNTRPLESDYEEVLTDHKRLVRNIDVIMNGKNAAQQASLCDLVGQIEHQQTKLTKQQALIEQLASALKAQHEWQIHNPIRDKEFEFSYAQEYGDSTMCDNTLCVLTEYQQALKEEV